MKRQIFFHSRSSSSCPSIDITYPLALATHLLLMEDFLPWRRLLPRML
jgi:hypothetical protein